MIDLFIGDDVDIDYLNLLYPDLYDDNNRSTQLLDIDSLNVKASVTTRDFSVLHLNICSFLPKYEEFLNYIARLNFNFHAFCFTETWLNDHTVNIVRINGYEKFDLVRPDKRGGGISIFVDMSFKSKCILSICSEYIEILCVETSHLNTKFLICTIYRPPNTNVDLFIDEVVRVISQFDLESYKNVIFCGDFNLNMLSLEVDVSVRRFIDCMYSVSLIPIITRPTRITEHSQTLIDNFFLHNPTNYFASTLLSDISDHFPIILICKDVFSSGPIREGIQVRFRQINDRTLNNFYNEISSHSFNDVLDQHDVCSATNKLCDVLFKCYDNKCPIKTKTLSYKDKIKPWIDSELKVLIKRREKYFILYRQSKLDGNIYRTFRNYVTKKLRLAKAGYFSMKFELYKSNMKKTWEMINELIKPNDVAGRKCPKIIVNDCELSTSEACNAFNDFFVNVGSNIANSLPMLTNSHLHMLPGNYLHSFFFPDVTSAEIKEIIMNLKNKNSDVNCFPVRALKYIVDLISPILSSLINKSVLDGCFPNCLKIARVVPIFKGGAKCNVGNYRPISVLPVLSKVFERVMYKRLYRYLCNLSILSERQFGFREGRGTINAVVDLYRYLYRQLDADNYVLSIFVDFQKAFDCVSHDILLSKLWHYGVRGSCHSWFKSYLSNREQFVSYFGATSFSRSIRCGVPQGSILGPLLFIVFINDVTSCTDKFKFSLYADDCTLSYAFKKDDIGIVADEVNAALGDVFCWLNANRLAINVSKTRYLIFSYRGDVDVDCFREL